METSYSYNIVTVCTLFSVGFMIGLFTGYYLGLRRGQKESQLNVLIANKVEGEGENDPDPW